MFYPGWIVTICCITQPDNYNFLTGRGIDVAFKVKLSFVCTAVFFIAIVICSGCVQTEGSEEKVLRVALTTGPDTGGSLDPSISWEGWPMRRTGIYETLFSYDENMSLQPELATGYKQLNDTSWEIQLRKNVTFHDGTKMNADAVIYSINRVLNSSNSRSAEYSFIKGVYKTDDYTIVVETNETYAPAILMFTDTIMSIVSPTSDLDKEPVGTGPYKFVSFEPGASIELVKNPDYWGGEPKIDRIIIQYSKDAAARTLLLKSGDVDITRDVLQSEYTTLEADPDINIVSRETLRTYFMYINEGKAPFDDVRVRQALNYVINRQEIVDTALEGVAGSPAIGIFPDIMPWSANDKIEAYDYNPEKALKLFAEAGITQGSDGRLYYNGKPFAIEIQTYTKQAAHQPMAEVIAAQFEKIGITTTIKIAETSSISADAVAGNYDLALYSWGVAPVGDPDYFVSSHFLSNGTYASTWLRYSNPQVDKWILEARAETDKEKRAELYEMIQEQVQNDAVLVCIAYKNEIDGLSPNLKGFEIYPNEYTFITKEMELA
ncbi:Oligopeptide ABC transporter, periplasmic oligopeptide-binding protein OppA [Methanosarcina barkeri 227]|uniref:Oligopeptide ABC transporter, periplasmic oligopeptide-binding protein OppA n=2 Tax=Methanosarcina barkeri TaxID=2208 RepID=A0A0E3QTM5_METBA|nr:Oligopeptide ABC transporter, periplasmic oligopeptide-binding protein OppA [Methanosarcina barkeri MS]AKB58009.1 Oligopeptide ABC transporter, periplasmic oligopeptide-binding protein OppA [Methanosarcina barkeri 227]